MCAALNPTAAFVVVRPPSSSLSMTSSSSSFVTFMSEDDHGEPVNTDDQLDESYAVDGAEEESLEQEEQVEEDPETIALKEEIAKLEAELKEKRRQVEYTADQADEYSQAGYARKVAEMENMRRARSVSHFLLSILCSRQRSNSFSFLYPYLCTQMLNTSNRSSSTAALLTKFLPTMDKLKELRAKYGEDDFGKQYNALPGTLMAGFSAMGVADYSVNAREQIDQDRMIVVGEEYSAELPAGTVIREVSSGLQLEGNVIRMAECVASLGPENAAEEDDSSAEAEEEAPEA